MENKSDGIFFIPSLLLKVYFSNITKLLFFIAWEGLRRNCRAVDRKYIGTALGIGYEFHTVDAGHTGLNGSHLRVAVVNEE